MHGFLEQERRRRERFRALRQAQATAEQNFVRIAVDAVAEELRAAYGRGADPDRAAGLLELVYDLYFAMKFRQVGISYDEDFTEYVRFCAERRLIRIVLGPNACPGQRLASLRAVVARGMRHPAASLDEVLPLVLADLRSRYIDLFAHAPQRLASRPGYQRARAAILRQQSRTSTSYDALAASGLEPGVSDGVEVVSLDELAEDGLDLGDPGQDLAGWAAVAAAVDAQSVASSRPRLARRCDRCGTRYASSSSQCPFCLPARPQIPPRQPSPAVPAVRRRAGEAVRIAPREPAPRGRRVEVQQLLSSLLTPRPEEEVARA